MTEVRPEQGNAATAETDQKCNAHNNLIQSQNGNHDMLITLY